MERYSISSVQPLLWVHHYDKPMKLFATVYVSTRGTAGPGRAAGLRVKYVQMFHQGLQREGEGGEDGHSKKPQMTPDGTRWHRTEPHMAKWGMQSAGQSASRARAAGSCRATCSALSLSFLRPAVAHTIHAFDELRHCLLSAEVPHLAGGGPHHPGTNRGASATAVCWRASCSLSLVYSAQGQWTDQPGLNPTCHAAPPPPAGMPGAGLHPGHATCQRRQQPGRGRALW